MLLIWILGKYYKYLSFLKASLHCMILIVSIFLKFKLFSSITFSSVYFALFYFLRVIVNNILLILVFQHMESFCHIYSVYMEKYRKRINQILPIQSYQAGWFPFFQLNIWWESYKIKKSFYNWFVSICWDFY